MRKQTLASFRICCVCAEIFVTDDKSECCGLSALLSDDVLDKLISEKVGKLKERRKSDMEEEWRYSPSNEPIEEYTVVEVEKVKKVKKTEIVNGKRRRIKKVKEEITTTKKKKIRPRIDDDLRSFVLKRDKNRCAECKCKIGLHIHHIVHRSKGGTDDPANLKTLCDLCHAEAHHGEPVYNLMIQRLFQYKAI